MNNKGIVLQIALLLNFFLVAYGSYFVLDKETAIQLVLEDNLFETLTAVFFLVTAYFFSRKFFATKNVYFVLLAALFVFGGGEEISWGQRYLGFGTPEAMQERNLQREFNLHNIDVFHPQDDGGVPKSGLSKLITVDFLYNLFWLSWCIVVPVLNYTTFFERLFSKIKLPIPVLLIGIFFLVNFAIFYLTRAYTSSEKSDIYYMRYREIFECCSALIFLLTASSFYKNHKTSAL